jgi:hypothetical protein
MASLNLSEKVQKLTELSKRKIAIDNMKSEIANIL